MGHYAPPGQGSANIESRNQIDFRVDCRGLWATMPQNLADLRQRCSLLKHLTGQSVTKLMCSFARNINPSSLQCVSHDVANWSYALKTANRRSHSQKYASAVGAWSPVLQVISDGLADIDRKRHLRKAARLSHVP